MWHNLEGSNRFFENQIGTNGGGGSDPHEAMDVKRHVTV